MNILKKENWWIWLLLLLLSSGSNTVVLAAILDSFDKKAWYSKWYYWVIGLVLLIPFAVMVYVFYIEMTCKAAAKLEVKGKEYYLSPYIWIIMIIIPYIGWFAFLALYLYLNIAILVNLKNGKGEKYIK
ncbi:MAG: hypothetical protein IJE04_02865 [Bacilli bacterium]|nr:hypothetical protein [Bacilli bacterium]